MGERSINLFLLAWYQITFKVIDNDTSASCSSLFKTEYHMECVGVLCGIYVVVDFLSQVIFIFLLLVSLE